ncbi:MAG: DUF1015 domain-containing protein [Deferrisomatales bacterium]|nr:DUF1015 domain-containing protein [Deferrisomatales bacterium]
MAEVLPFRGIRFNPRHVPDLNDVMTPPYDVIGPEMQEQLYRRSPYNIVRLDYGKILPGDDEVENRYTRAGRLLHQWLAIGVLTQERECSIYYTEQDYAGEFREPTTRKGFLAAVRLEDPESGLYLPHERTLAGPKADRLRLMQACRANLSPIFGLYDDPTFRVLRDVEIVPLTSGPLLTVRMEDGSVTRLWRISDPGLMRAVSAGLSANSFVIADGHHRYETALTYRDLRRAESPGFTGREPWNYVLMYLTNLSAPGLTVFPTHRAVFGLEGFRLGEFLERAGRYFQVEEHSGPLDGLMGRMKELRGRAHALGLVAPGDDRLRLLVLRDEAVMKELLEGRMASVLRTLDVTVLHSLVLEHLLGVDQRAQEEQRNLSYIKGHDELVRVVREEPGIQLGFLLNPTRVEEVKAVAQAGERMPQKSTFFFPKQVTGLVINPLFDETEICRL